MDPGHPAVAGPGPRFAVRYSALASATVAIPTATWSNCHGERIRARQGARGQIEHQADHDDVADGSEARPLAQRDPAEEDDQADDDRRPTEVERRPPRNTLGEHRPRRVAEAGGDE